MTKLTKHNSFRSLKQSRKSNATPGTDRFTQLPELKLFLNLLRQKLIKTSKIKK